MVCPHVRDIIHPVKLVSYVHLHADNPWYNYYLKAYILLYERIEKGVRNFRENLLYSSLITCNPNFDSRINLNQ